MFKTDFNIDFLPYAKISSEKWKSAAAEAKKISQSEPDDIIHAYHSGVDKGMAANQQVLMKSFIENIEKAFSISENLYFDINTDKFVIASLFLKANHISSFDVLFLVDLKHYLSDQRKKVYEIARNIKKSSNKDLFEINFSFMPTSENINYNLLESDGFVYRYEASARKA
jgi:hypothetical protein